MFDRVLSTSLSHLKCLITDQYDFNEVIGSLGLSARRS